MILKTLRINQLVLNRTFKSLEREKSLIKKKLKENYKKFHDLQIWDFILQMFKLLHFWNKRELLSLLVEDQQLL